MQTSVVSTSLLTMLLFFSAARGSSAQTPAPRKASSSVPVTRLSFEVLLAPQTTGIDAQRWGPVFQRLGESVRFRQPLLDDRPDVTETTRGRTRLVTITGELKPDGTLAFPGKSFRLSETRRLAEWIQELRTYGAQGAPDGKPGFGLSGTQLEQLLRSLEVTVHEEVGGDSILKAVPRLGFPDSLPVRFSSAAEERLVRLPSGIVAPHGLKGMSRGTALAILLRRAGLGFRPGRTPAGTLQLLVVPAEESDGLWPIGWPLDRPPVQAAPEYVSLKVFDLDDEPLTDVLESAREETGIRILIDVRGIAEADVDFESMTVTQRPRRMTWAGLLDRGTFPDLMAELLQDEAGRPFVWLTTRTIRQLNEREQQRKARRKAQGR